LNNSNPLYNIPKLFIKTKKIVEGYLLGIHKSPYHGFSQEFSEYKLYTPEDNPKWIDWKIYARTEKLFVKKFEHETNLYAYLILDISNSMNYGDKITKFEFAKNLAASIAYILYKQKDAVGLVTFSEKINNLLRPQNSYLHIIRMFKILEDLKTQGKTKIFKSLKNFVPSLNKKGLIFVISDFYTNLDDVFKFIKSLKSKGQDVKILQVVSQKEKNVDFSKPAKFVDSETGEYLETFGDFSKDYTKFYEKFINAFRKNVISLNVDYHIFKSEDNFLKSFLKFLYKLSKV